MGNTPWNVIHIMSSSFDAGSFSTSALRVGAGVVDVRRCSPLLIRKKKGLMQSYESFADRDEYGWFADVESPYHPNALADDFEEQSSKSQRLLQKQPLQRALSLPLPASEPPLYVLESSLETQQLWYNTAGRRPKQPEEERQYFEKLWRQNFEQSHVIYPESLLAELTLSSSAGSGNTPRPNGSFDATEHGGHGSSTNGSSAVSDNGNGGMYPEIKGKRSRNPDVIPPSETNGEVLYRGREPFSNSVSKCFLDDTAGSITVSMPYFRVLRSLNGSIFAEYLIVASFGSKSPVTLGIWKRFSEFQQLARSIESINLKSGNVHDFKNSALSWQCVLQRKRWFKSLDKDYLTLKCFLLERFIHDVLFESPTPDILSKFLGLSDA